MMPARYCNPVAAHDGRAARAAATARSTSPAEPSAAMPVCSPVAGLKIGDPLVHGSGLLAMKCPAGFIPASLAPAATLRACPLRICCIESDPHSEYPSIFEFFVNNDELFNVRS